MAYLKVDDNISHNRKLLRAGDVAGWLYVCGLAYCQRHGTNGAIHAEALPILGCKGWKRAAASLVEAGLWHSDGAGGYRVHDFLDWNASAEERLEKAAAKPGSTSTLRVQRFRERQRASQAPVTSVSETARNALPKRDETRTPHLDQHETPKPFQGAPVSAVTPSANLEPAASSFVAGAPTKLEARPVLFHLGLEPIRVTSSLGYGLRHSDCEVGGFCAWMCLPAELVTEWANRIGGASAPDATPAEVAAEHAAARVAVVDKAGAVMAAWRAATPPRIPTGKKFDFWRLRLAEAFGACEDAAAAPAGRDALSGVRAAVERLRAQQ